MRNRCPTQERPRAAGVTLRILLLVALCMTAACGKKGPPRAPRAVIPPAVSDLRADAEGSRIELSWSIPRRDGDVVEGIEGFQIFRFKTEDPEKLCVGCPVEFRKFEEVDLDTRAGRGAGIGDEDRVTVYDALQPGYGYMYKVRVVHESGGLSKDSNLVKVLPR